MQWAAVSPLKLEVPGAREFKIQQPGRLLNH